MPANTTKLPSEKVNTSDKRRHTSCIFHTSGIGIARIIESVSILSTPFAMPRNLRLKHACNRHQQQGVCGAEAAGKRDGVRK